ncbi:MAG TPA: hypothetical protein VK993_12405 [Chthoniobacterales bacterium]|nr:hypothetical protein [Chthoniobacterales bacterium]
MLAKRQFFDVTTSIIGKTTVAVLVLTGAMVMSAGAEPREKQRRGQSRERVQPAERAQSGERQTAGGLIVDSEERYVRLTGSNIPQRVRRRSIGTDSAFNVRIFTQRELQTINGGFGVSGIALDPSIRISGR